MSAATQTRAQRRYAAYLDSATGMPFGDWLRAGAEQAQPEELTCCACNGSGEGQHDGTSCHWCHGSGIEGYQPTHSACARHY